MKILNKKKRNPSLLEMELPETNSDTLIRLRPPIYDSEESASLISVHEVNNLIRECTEVVPARERGHWYSIPRYG